MTQNNNSIKPDPQSLQMAVKSRFFAQYWGTKTLYVGGVGKVEVGNGGWNLKRPDFFLQLKPLSKITDEDAGKIPYRNSSDNIIGYYTAKSLNKNIECIGFYTNEEIDNLRLLGYAVPFMEYSVDDLISFGWVQLL